ncbi:hypothetical protein Vadar_002789 [Vaccinium darrowii]|uniref:Uncharacterized protein n=1 Tax=Vaccinium darrowii TaxID=229202 RepID=A0ACB7Y4V6_9ERIC|nr:hypothetical protein Vadar_002789 [Vaccinium darrowii]
MEYNSSPHSGAFFPIGSDSGSKSPSLEYVEGSTSRGSPQSDEELMITLASSQPKKRAGRKKFKETRHPIYRGVRRRNNDRWVCELREPNKKSRLWLGTYPTAEMAARAHDVAALALKSESSTACLNFADSVWRLPVPVSKEAEHIRRAATEAAEMFRQQPPNDGGGVNVVSSDGDGSGGNGSEVFDMDELLLNMAEGPLLSPSPSYSGRRFSWDDVGSDVEVSLWS